MGNKHLPGQGHMDLESQVLLLFFMELFPIKIINFIKKYGSYSKTAREVVENTFENFSKRIILPIVAGKNDLEDLITKNLDIHDVGGKGDDLINRLKNLSEEQQLVMFVDELGKYLGMRHLKIKT